MKYMITLYSMVSRLKCKADGDGEYYFIISVAKEYYYYSRKGIEYLYGLGNFCMKSWVLSFWLAAQ